MDWDEETAVKIVSWNVNGLRALISKDALEAVVELSPDVLCFQEIKVKPEQLVKELEKLYKR